MSPVDIAKNFLADWSGGNALIARKNFSRWGAFDGGCRETGSLPHRKACANDSQRPLRSMTRGNTASRHKEIVKIFGNKRPQRNIARLTFLKCMGFLTPHCVS